MVVPFPSWPKLLKPQANTVPLEFRASPWNPPAATAVMLLKLVICTGLKLFTVVPMPSGQRYWLPRNKHSRTK